jgi:hypothetical protein
MAARHPDPPPSVHGLAALTALARGPLGIQKRRALARLF